MMAKRDDLQTRITGAAERLRSLSVQYRALRLPMVMSLPAKILQEMDLSDALTSHFIVVGSLAMTAYELEAVASLFAGIGQLIRCVAILAAKDRKQESFRDLRALQSRRSFQGGCALQAEDIWRSSCACGA